MIGADFNGYVGEGTRGDEEVIGRYGVKEKNVEKQIARRVEMVVVITYSKKSEEYRAKHKS